MSLIIFMVTLIAYTEGQSLYNDIENNISFYTTQACYKECYDRDVQLQTQVTNLENQLNSLREKEEILQFQLKCENKTGKYQAGNVTDTQYCFIRSSLTWDDGKTKCQSFNSYLLEINSEAEQSWLMEEISEDRWWIGAREDTDNEVWVWDHSGDELVFQNWDTVGSQPSGGTAEDCALSDEGLWHDYPCDSRYNIICERGK
ncbi:collectin-12-like isoform X1 [Crassostrea angulata]|uniref:collectin-12-like isoform X1 n=1 Tax=Magallana angulata TaxID=2784310 RepID=UPI0022B203BE|nr:collectin-12-like isoform X1 [Crassostrea angulata]